MEHAQKIIRPPNPRKGANVLSILSFAFTLPTFRRGLRKDLQEEDITEHMKEHDSKTLGDRLDEAWRKELRLNQHPSLWRAIRRVFGLEFMSLGVMVLFIELIVKISQPIALSQLIQFYSKNEKEVSLNKAYMYAGIIVGASFLNVLLGHFYMLNLMVFGMKLRIACCSVVYRKSLRLSKSVLGGTTIGQMVNLLSNDVNRCDRAVNHVHHLWICPIETLIILYLLYRLAGWTSTIGVFFLVLFIPLQMYLGKKTSIYRLKTALRTDERVRLMNEIVSGIQVIKMYTWEKPFAKFVAIARRLEIRYVRATCYIRGVLLSLTIFTSSFAVFLTILTYVLLGNALDAEYVFVVTSFYSILKQTLTKYVPRGIAEVAEINVSISRLQKFLLYDEVKEDITTKSCHNSNGKTDHVGVEIQLQNVSAKWCSNSSDYTLHEINFTARSGLTAIIGPVGSGKTSLLHVLLKELPLVGGTMRVQGNISYASQESWVFAGSVRQNILFGQPMVRERYQDVIRACALERDLFLLPNGDETLVGERGVTLSGGQRARLSLARAIYKPADIYLLDDPLSAVDAHVGKQLFDECICGFLQNKCTVLVTHQLQYLGDVNQIILIENGRVTISGTYQALRESKIDFTKLLHVHEDKNEMKGDTKQLDLKKRLPNQNGARVETKEQRSLGKISRDVYISYIKAGGSTLTCLGLLSLFIITQVSVSGTDYFLTYWVNMEQETSGLNNTLDFLELSRDTCLYIYSGIIACTLILAIYRSFAFFKYCMKASTNLHNTMFSNIVYAPMRFFHTNSSGRILNRFSKDMGSIDEVLPVVAIDCIHCGLVILSVTTMVSLVNPWLLIVTAIIAIIFYVLSVVYMKTSRNVKRLEGITRSPVFAHISASLQGLTTIRAFGAQTILQKEFDDHQDLHSSVWYLFLTCSRAFGFWLDVICVIYIAIVTFSFFLIETEQYGGNVGLAITQAMILTGTFQWALRQWTELENQMTSVERVMEYTTIDHEVNPSEKLPSPNWPEHANIEFASVALRYSPTDPYVLKQLTFSVKSKQKIGIVGRTGAGKTSLIYALFQLAPTEGTLLIDQIDITKIPLNNLRSKISIIPQEPVLFSGTLRKNLDPFEEYSDTDIWAALEEVELKSFVADLPSGLNDRVFEGGSNFSVGQRQLVCLARAVIRKNKILVLDEATANVDHRTDALIQKTIRRKFDECTVLTIAHRLNTVIDSDKIVVMDAGKVVEFNHPHLLLKNQKGLFYALVQQTGVAMAENLSKIAENVYKQNF